MNDQLQKALAQFLQLMLDGIQKGAGFAQEQLPLVIQEKLHYELYSSLVWIGIWIFLLAIAWGAQQLMWRMANASEKKSGRTYKSSEEEGMQAVPTVIAVIMSVIGLCDIIYNIDHFVYIWLAPRVYILGWLKDLIK